MQFGWMATFHEFSSNFGRVPSPLAGPFGTRTVSDLNCADIVQRKVQSANERTLKGRSQLQSCRWIDIELDAKCRSQLPSLCLAQRPAKHSNRLSSHKSFFKKIQPESLMGLSYRKIQSDLIDSPFTGNEISKKKRRESSLVDEISKVRWHFGVRQVISNQPCARYRPLLSPAPSERATLEHFDSKFSVPPLL